MFIPDLFREVAPGGVRDVERLAARPGARWYAAGTVGGVTFDDEVELRHGDVAVDGDAALFERGCNWVKAAAWRAEDDGGPRSEESGRFGLSGMDPSTHRGVGGSTQATESIELDSGSILGGCAHV